MGKCKDAQHIRLYAIVDGEGKSMEGQSPNAVILGGPQQRMGAEGDHGPVDLGRQGPGDTGTEFGGSAIDRADNILYSGGFVDDVHLLPRPSRRARTSAITTSCGTATV